MNDATKANDIFDRPIAFHRAFVSLVGSNGKRLGVTGALMLSQALYWANRTDNNSGWFWKTAEEWEEETGLTYEEQRTARKRLRGFSFWQEERREVPAKMFFRVDADLLLATLIGEIPNSSSGDSPEQEQGNSQNINRNAETTSKTTSIGTSASASQKERLNKARASVKQLSFVGEVEDENQQWANRKKLTSIPHSQYMQILEDIGYKDGYEWLISLLPTVARATGKKKDRPSTVGEARSLLEAVKTLSEQHGFSDAEIRQHIESRANWYADKNRGKLKPIWKWSAFADGLASEKSVDYLMSLRQRKSKARSNGVDKILSEEEMEKAMLEGA